MMRTIADRLLWEITYWRQWSSSIADLWVESCRIALKEIEEGTDPVEALDRHLRRKGWE